MTTHSAPFLSRIGIGALLGAATGAVFLGVGGRLVMWVFAVVTRGDGGFTLGGTLSVIASGAIAGAIGGALFGATARFLPQRPWVRGVVFAGVCYLIATPGFRPPQPLVFALFAPAFLGYGLLQALAWDRMTGPRAAAARTRSPEP